MTGITKTLVVAVCACGILCSCSSNPLQRWSSDIARAKMAREPILLYSIPFTVFPSLANVGVVNTSSRQISKFDIVITGCWTNSETWKLEFNGPISAGHAATVKSMLAYQIGPSGTYIASVNKAPDTLWVNRLIVKAVIVQFSDGRTAIIGTNLHDVLASRVPNYCPARMNGQTIADGNYVR